MAKRYWETLLKDKDKSKPWWIKMIFVIGTSIGVSIVVFFLGLLFLLLGFVFSVLWNYTVAPIFDVMEITTYMAAALLALIFCSIRLLKWAFKS